MPSSQASALQMPSDNPLIETRPPAGSHRPSAARTTSLVMQAYDEAWSVVHHAERLGHRDISDALHHAIDAAASASSFEQAAVQLDAARESALARLDMLGALVDEP